MAPLWQIFSHQSILPGENGGVSLDFLTRVSFEGERGNFLTRVFLRGGMGGKLLLCFLFTGRGRGPAKCLAIDDTIDGGQPSFALRKYV